MAETEHHRVEMNDGIGTLADFFRSDANVYVGGNLLVFYKRGDRLAHVSPDIFVVRGVPKLPIRRNWLIWEEGKGPEVVIELTSASTREEDMDDKFALYRDELKVREYFLFDPFREHLDPPLQGFRLRRSGYVRIRAVKGRLPSVVLRLQVAAVGSHLRFYDPVTRRTLATPGEARARAEAAACRAEAAARQAQTEAEHEAQARRQAEAAARQAQTEAEHEAQARRQAEAAQRVLESECKELRAQIERLRREHAGKRAREPGAG
jgi:Uma2 family endonuclease